MRYLKRHSKELNGLLKICDKSQNPTYHSRNTISSLSPNGPIFSLAKVSVPVHDDAAVFVNRIVCADYSAALRVDGDVRRVLGIRGEGQVGVCSDDRESMPGS